MADAQKLLPTDTLRVGYPKINDAIDNANEALTKSNTAIADSAEALSNSENTQQQLDTIVINGDSSVEAAQARVDSDNNTFATLKERLDTKEDSFTAQLATLEQEKANADYVQTLINSVTGLGIKDVYYTYEALKSAFPQGTEGVFIVLNTDPENPHKYAWSSTIADWVDLGPYQWNSIPDGTVTISKLDSNLRTNLSEFEQLPFNVINTGFFNVGSLSRSTASGFRYITVDCKEGEEYEVDSTINGVNMALIVFLDENGIYHNYLERGVSGDSVYVGYKFIIPKGVKQFEFAYRRGYRSSIKKRNLNIKSNLSLLENVISHYSDVASYETTSSYFISLSSLETGYNTNVSMEKVTCVAGEKYKVSATMASNNVDTYALIMMYSNSDNFMGYIERCTSTNATQTFTDVEFTIPDGVAYFYLQHTKADSFSIKKLTYINVKEIADIVASIDISTPSKPKIIDCWGDSLTAGAGGGGTTHPLVLQSKLGSEWVVNNMGVGGETANTIAGRQGGLPMTLNEGFTIPVSTTPVEVSFKNFYHDTPSPLRQGNNGNWGINPCYINGVEGELSITQTSSTSSDNKYYFTRAEAGEEVVIDKPTLLTTNNMLTKRNNLMIIFMGQNGGSTNLESKIRWMLDYSTRPDSEYIILGLTSGTASASLEERMYWNFGRHYINLRGYMTTPIYDTDGTTIISCYGLRDAGLVATADDLTYIAQGKIPPSLLSDSVHGNEHYYRIIGTLVYERGKELGYW